MSPTKQGARRSVWVLAIVAAASVAACSSWGYVGSIRDDHGTYYRVKVKLAYKGEPQDFDIVVGCNVREIIYRDNSSTHEVGLVPTVFGRRMSDGKGLVVRPPEACNGETTANGHVQPDLLPVVVVYHDAETLSFGIAYMSEDAYDNPLSVLKFGGATIEKATRAEFEEFRRAQPNLVRRESYWSSLDSDNGLKEKHFKRLTRPFGNSCKGYRRFRIPQAMRSLVRRHWPDGHPVYWRANTYEAEHEIVQAFIDSPLIKSDRTKDMPGPWDTLAHTGNSNLGLITRTGGGFASAAHGVHFPTAFYPATTDYDPHLWPLDLMQWGAYLAAKDVFVVDNIDFRDGRMRGFAYCSGYFRQTRESVPSLARIDQLPKVIRIDGQDVASMRPVGPGAQWLFERDEYLFEYFDINLESTRGDI